MTWIRYLGWATLTAAFLAIAAIPDLVTLPEPEGGIVLDHANYESGKGEGREVRLPAAIFPGSGNTANVVRYTADFDLAALPDKGLFVFIPLVNRRIAMEFNGESFYEFESNAFWTGVLVSTPVMVRLPRDRMIAGHNRLTVLIDRGPYVVPAYLSKIYLGSEAALTPPFKLRNFLEIQLKTMALAGQFVLALGFIFAYFFRPQDPVFSWLAILNVVSLTVAVAGQIGWQPAFLDVLPFINLLIPPLGFLFLGFVLGVVNIRPPNVLRYAAIAVPCLLLPVAMVDTAPARLIVGGLGVATLIVSYVLAAGLLAWSAFQKNNFDARLILAPVLLIVWFAVRDVFVTVTAPEHGFNLLVGYARPLLLAFVAAMLMRRMGVSLDRLDHANETLNIRLAEREAELATFHRLERAKTVSTVREHERQRLTHDLHDGLSGHLASIIALSERAGDKPIEQAAREALNDLRLVIYSLDLGDRELPLALANFRERLVPQLQRLGIALDWSIAGLPEVSGVTPGNALAMLRILQEAITNAIKHGPARKVVIRGARAKDGMVALSIENDGRPFTEGTGGHGLANMRRRAQQLNGKLDLEALDSGTKLTLLLPPSLPDFEDETVA
ncbi:MAG: ATP-binding protein [Pseudolabrys sp.]